MRYKQLVSWLGFITLGVVTGFLIGSGITYFNVSAQILGDKKVIKPADTLDPQVKFSGLKVGGRERTLGEKFDAGAEWLKDISFNMQSIADKPIVFLQVNVNFPETRATGNLMSYTMLFGEMPGRKHRGSKPMMLRPNETIEVLLSSEIEKISKFIKERQPIETINQVELEIGFVVFDDKTGWNAGYRVQPDENNPGRYKPIDKKPQD